MALKLWLFALVTKLQVVAPAHTHRAAIPTSPLKTICLIRLSVAMLANQPDHLPPV